MNTKNNLHNALNKAFENHTEPLYQAQWDRLEGAMAKKKKRRFFPFFLLFTVICITAGSTYFLTLNYGLKNNQTSAFPTEQKSNYKNNVSPKNKDIATVFPQTNVSNPTNINSISTHPSSKIIKSKKAKKNKPNQNPDINTGDKYYLPTLPENSNPSLPENTNPSPSSESTLPVKDIVMDIPEKEDKFELREVPTDKTEMDVSLKNKDKTDPNNKDNGDGGKKTSPPKFVFSFAAMGYGKLNVKVSDMENSEMLHKDTRKIFEESNQNIKSEFVGFGFDWNIFPRYKIGFNTGIQYLRLATPVNINYLLTEVPFWDRRHSQIEGYVTDTTPLKFNSYTTNYTTYITIPLRFNYSIPINPKNEILVTGGVNLSTLISAKGQSVTINKELNREPGVKPLNSDAYRRFNPGFTGGLQYNFKFKDSWWIGMESLYQINPMKYKTGYGSIKNTLDGYIINAIIKYKI